MAAEDGAANSSDKGTSPQGKAATQDRILQAAMSLFMRRGYARTSVTQIASKAGVSRAAVFWHFSDKDTLFRAAAKQFVVPFREGLSRHMRHFEPRKRIIELISYYERFVERFPDADAALKPIEDLAVKLDDDPETQSLLRTICQDERSTLEFFYQACEQLNG